MIFLKRLDRVAAFLQGGNAQRRGFRAAERRHDRRAGVNGSGADFHFVGPRALAGRRVDHELNFAVLQQVDGVGTSFRQFEDASHLQPGFFQHRRRAAGGNQFKAEIGKQLRHIRDFAFCARHSR